MSNFRQIDRETGFLLPPSVDEWLPENHLARFVVEVIAGRVSKGGQQQEWLPVLAVNAIRAGVGGAIGLAALR